MNIVHRHDTVAIDMLPLRLSSGNILCVGGGT
jgi:hypothetical protein